jgi:hypothetical protein
MLQPTRAFPSALSPGWSPFLAADMATSFPGKATTAGLSPARSSASIAAPNHDIPDFSPCKCKCAGTNRRDAMEEEAIRRRNSEPLRPRVMRRSARKDSGEALTGARAGWAMEPRNCVHFRAPTLFAFAEGNTSSVDIARRSAARRGRRPHARTEASRTGAGRSRARLPQGWRQTAKGSPRAIA